MGEQVFLGKHMGGVAVLLGELVTRSCQGCGSSRNTLFSTLKTVHLKIVLFYKQKYSYVYELKGYTLEDKVLTSL